MSSIGCCCAEKNKKAIMSSLTEMSSPLQIPTVTTFQWGWRHYWLVTGMSSLTEMSSPLEIPIVTTFQWGWRHYWLVTGMSSLHILLCFSPNLYIQSISYSISKESLSFGLSFDGRFCFVWPVQLFECEKYGFGDDIPVITLDHVCILDIA